MVKYGYTNDLNRRYGEHTRTFGSFGIAIELITYVEMKDDRFTHSSNRLHDWLVSTESTLQAMFSRFKLVNGRSQRELLVLDKTGNQLVMAHYATLQVDLVHSVFVENAVLERRVAEMEREHHQQRIDCLEAEKAAIVQQAAYLTAMVRLLQMTLKDIAPDHPLTVSI